MKIGISQEWPGEAGVPAAGRAPVSAIFLFHGLVIGGWATQVPLLQVRLGLAPAALGFALFCAAAGALASMPATGAIASRAGPAPVLRVGSALTCIAFVAAVLAPGFAALCVALLLFGAGYGAVDVAMNTEAVRVEQVLRRPILGGVHAMWSAGSLAGSAGGAALLTLVAPSVQAALLAGLAVCAMQVAAGMIDGGAAAAGAARDPAVRPWRDGRLLFAGFLLCLAFSVEGAVADWGGVYLRSVRHVPAPVAALGYSAFSACMVVMRLAGDRVRAAVGDGGMLAGAFAAAAGLVIALAAPSGVVAVAGFGVAGLGAANVVPVLFAFSGRGGAASVSVATTIGYAGVLGGPPLFGAVAQATSLQGALALAAGFCCVIGGSAWLAGRGFAPDRRPGS